MSAASALSNSKILLPDLKGILQKCPASELGRGWLPPAIPNPPLDFHLATASSASLCSQTSCQHPLISATAHQSAISPSFPAHLSTWHHLLLDVYTQCLDIYCCSLQGVWVFPSWPACILFCVISGSSAVSESASYFLWGQIPIFIFPLFRSFELLNPWVC